MADDEGYLKAHPAIIKSQLFPFTDNSLSVQELIIELSDVGYIDVLTCENNKQYIHVKNFLTHQKVNRPTPSKIRVEVKFIENSLSNHGQLTIGKEGKGKEQGKERNKEIMPAKADESKIIFDYWKQVMQKNNSSKFTKERSGKVKARLKDGYTVDQIKQAILGCSMTPHNMGKNENGKLYDDLELICRSGSNVERFAQNVNTVIHNQPMSDAARQTLEAGRRGAPEYAQKRLG